MAATPRGRIVEPRPFSLVLGAGGRPGLAFHAGTLLALELHGVAPTEAVSITGTSAGSIAAALLATGGTVEDLAAFVVGAAPRHEYRATAELLAACEGRPFTLDRRAWRHLVDLRRSRAVLDNLMARRFMAALAMSVPGVIEIARRFELFDSGGARVPWRIVAADLRGVRHVLAPETTPLSRAVAASCAVPGLFAPVQIGGRRLIDGGVHSTTNADLAATDGTPTVIVVAPMCGHMASTHPSPADVSLRREITLLERSGRRVVTFMPSAALRRTMGRNPLSNRQSRAITGAAFLEAADGLAVFAQARRPIAAVATAAG